MKLKKPKFNYKKKFYFKGKLLDLKTDKDYIPGPGNYFMDAWAVQNIHKKENKKFELKKVLKNIVNTFNKAKKG